MQRERVTGAGCFWFVFLAFVWFIDVMCSKKDEDDD